MDAYIFVSIGIVFLCFVVSGFFSGSETAMTATSKIRIRSLGEKGDDRAGLVERLLGKKERLIGGILIGNNIVNTGAAALSTGVLLSLFGEAGILYATIIVSVLVIIFCEILPKTIAINHPDRVALLVSRPLSVIVAALGPVIVIIEALVRRLVVLFGIRDGGIRDILSGTEELRGQVQLLHQEGEVGKAERDMFEGLLDLQDLTVEDVMMHRSEMRAINADLPASEIVSTALSFPFTRVPLWRGSPDNIVGLLHAKDLLRALHAESGWSDAININKIALDPWFVPAVTPLRAQLNAFLARKQHFALVVDEYGKVLGLVTLEDILEEIVGDIRDEHDEVKFAGIELNTDGSLEVDGLTPIRDLNRAMDWSLPDEDATTVAGLVINEAQQIPDEGKSVDFLGHRFEVRRRLGHRIARIKIAPTSAVN
ncbi:MAG: HlyC/CorC family transporter [Rhizobiales bacterium]|nr:HlyC/CorC family transporter [Hyphomicrobiales bacterium]